jgi:hypothetical protein
MDRFTAEKLQTSTSCQGSKTNLSNLFGTSKTVQVSPQAAIFWPRNSLALSRSASHFFSCSRLRKLTTAISG